jgi:two-component system sensor histidine kinase KdpD
MVSLFCGCYALKNARPNSIAGLIGQICNQAVSKVKLWPPTALRVGQYVTAVLALAILTYAGLALHMNRTSIGCLYLLLIFALATGYGFWPASVLSVIAVGCLDYFFTPPVFHFNIVDVQDWVALGVFQFAAIVIGRLSAKELRSSKDAAARRAELAQLYEVSRHSLLLDLHREPGPQLVVLIQRAVGLEAVALYHAAIDRHDSVGEWKGGEEYVAKDCYFNGDSTDDPVTRCMHRILRSSKMPVGALVLRGAAGSMVTDALAALASMVIERYESFEKEELASNASKSEQLRASVMDALAHELKTPLSTARLANSGLGEVGSLSETQSDLVQLVDAELARMSELCSRLLMTAKLGAGQVGLNTESVNVKDAITEAVEDANRTGKRIRIDVHDAALSVCAERSLLLMMLVQYIDNACKYSSPEREIVISAKQSFNEVLITVHNYGPVIRIEDRERIFDRFYRAPNGVNTVIGTGIGLSVVKKTAEAHHGHVWMVSDETEGTTFFLSLPSSTKGSKP